MPFRTCRSFSRPWKSPWSQQVSDRDLSRTIPLVSSAKTGEYCHAWVDLAELTALHIEYRECYLFPSQLPPARSSVAMMQHAQCLADRPHECLHRLCPLNAGSRSPLHYVWRCCHFGSHLMLACTAPFKSHFLSVKILLLNHLVAPTIQKGTADPSFQI